MLRPGLQATATWVLFLLLISGTSPMRAAAGVGSCGPANERARPSQPEMSECLGDTCGEARDVRSALEAAPQRCRGKSCSSEAAKASAKTHIRRGQLTDAFGVLAELIRLDPTSIRPFLAEEEQTKAPPDPAEAVRFYQSRVDSARSKGDRLAEARALPVRMIAPAGSTGTAANGGLRVAQNSGLSLLQIHVGSVENPAVHRTGSPPVDHGT